MQQSKGQGKLSQLKASNSEEERSRKSKESLSEAGPRPRRIDLINHECKPSCAGQPCYEVAWPEKKLQPNNTAPRSDNGPASVRRQPPSHSDYPVEKPGPPTCRKGPATLAACSDTGPLWWWPVSQCPTLPKLWPVPRLPRPQGLRQRCPLSFPNRRLVMAPLWQSQRWASRARYQ